jgi:hypothetical protein
MVKERKYSWNILRTWVFGIEMRQEHFLEYPWKDKKILFYLAACSAAYVRRTGARNRQLTGNPLRRKLCGYCTSMRYMTSRIDVGVLVIILISI